MPRDIPTPSPEIPTQPGENRPPHPQDITKITDREAKIAANLSGPAMRQAEEEVKEEIETAQSSPPPEEQNLDGLEHRIPIEKLGKPEPPEPNKL